MTSEAFAAEVLQDSVPYRGVFHTDVKPPVGAKVTIQTGLSLKAGKYIQGDQVGQQSVHGKVAYPVIDNISEISFAAYQKIRAAARRAQRRAARSGQTSRRAPSRRVIILGAAALGVGAVCLTTLYELKTKPENSEFNKHTIFYAIKLRDGVLTKVQAQALVVSDALSESDPIGKLTPQQRSASEASLTKQSISYVDYLWRHRAQLGTDNPPLGLLNAAYDAARPLLRAQMIIEQVANSTTVPTVTTQHKLPQSGRPKPHLAGAAATS